MQFKERPIPNFYHLAGKSAHVDGILKDGNTVELEQGLQIKAIATAGHSAGHLLILADCQQICNVERFKKRHHRVTRFHP